MFLKMSRNLQQSEEIRGRELEVQLVGFATVDHCMERRDQKADSRHVSQGLLSENCKLAYSIHTSKHQVCINFSNILQSCSEAL